MQTTGVIIERNTQGVPRFARIDLKKYGEKLMPFFKEIGVGNELSSCEKDDDTLYFKEEWDKSIAISIEQHKAGKVKRVNRDKWKQMLGV
jgi:hypothetical protein